MIRFGMALIEMIEQLTKGFVKATGRQPDNLEKLKGAKASGLPLTYELRKMDIPVVNFSPSKGNDKHVRVNAVAPLFESGMIWAPEQKFADDVIVRIVTGKQHLHVHAYHFL